MWFGIALFGLGSFLCLISFLASISGHNEISGDYGFKGVVYISFAFVILDLHVIKKKMGIDE